MHQEINNAKIFVSLENTDLPNTPKKKKKIIKQLDTLISPLSLVLLFPFYYFNFTDEELKLREIK